MKKQAARGGQSETTRACALQINVAHSAAHWRQAKLALGREAGDRLCQLVKEDGKLVAVLVWCAAAGHLQVRDETVGWAAVTRSQRHPPDALRLILKTHPVL